MNMTITEIYNWAKTSPVLGGETLNLEFLPAYRGWSLSFVRELANTDILGFRTAVTEVRISRRWSVDDNAGRAAVMDELWAFAQWAKRNPPEGARVTLGSLPKFSGRSPSGTEDLAILLRIYE